MYVGLSKYYYFDSFCSLSNCSVFFKYLFTSITVYAQVLGTQGLIFVSLFHHHIYLLASAAMVTVARHVDAAQCQREELTTVKSQK